MVVVHDSKTETAPEGPEGLSGHPRCQCSLGVLLGLLALGALSPTPLGAAIPYGDYNADGRFDIADVANWAVWLYNEWPGPACGAMVSAAPVTIVIHYFRVLLLGQEPFFDPDCSGTAVVEPEKLADFELGFEQGGALPGAPEGAVRLEVFVTLTTANNTYDAGALGWSLSVGGEGLTFVSMTREGTIAASTRDDPPGIAESPLVHEEVVDPSLDTGAGPQGAGAVSGVVLSFRGFEPPVTLPREGTVRIARLVVEVPVSRGKTAPRLSFADGKQGRGRPVSNLVALGRWAHRPVTTAELELTTLFDCNRNGTPDDIDIASGASPDCDASLVPDECELRERDCNRNGALDECDIATGASADCDADGVPDECLPPDADCNRNGRPDSCDITSGASRDCDQDRIPDECHTEPIGCPPPIAWTRRFGTEELAAGRAVAQVDGGGYAVAGTAAGERFDVNDLYLARLDGSGAVLWERRLGGPQNDEGSSIAPTRDGGFIVAGVTGDFGDGAIGSDVYLVKTDGAGEVVWERTFGGDYFDAATAVLEAREGGYVAAGASRRFPGPGGTQAYVVRTDAAGELLWERAYLLLDGDFLSFSSAASLRQTADGGFILAGSAGSRDDGSEFLLLKTDRVGNRLWHRTFGGQGDDTGEAVIETAGGGFLIAGSTYSSGAGGQDLYLVHTDRNGTVIWERTLGGSEGDRATSLAPARAGGYIVAGLTHSSPFPGVYLTKVDDAGDSLWRTVIRGDYETAAVCSAADGGFIVAAGTGDGGENGVLAVKFGPMPSGPAAFIRGDCNDDGTVDISDAVFSLGSLFLGDREPGCDDACDSNDDGTVDISDAIATLGVLFLGNGTIPLPGMEECGVDPTDDEVRCETFRRCP